VKSLFISTMDLRRRKAVNSNELDYLRIRNHLFFNLVEYPKMFHSSRAAQTDCAEVAALKKIKSLYDEMENKVAQDVAKMQTSLAKEANNIMEQLQVKLVKSRNFIIGDFSNAVNRIKQFNRSLLANATAKSEHVRKCEMEQIALEQNQELQRIRNTIETRMAETKQKVWKLRGETKATLNILNTIVVKNNDPKWTIQSKDEISELQKLLSLKEQHLLSVSEESEKLAAMICEQESKIMSRDLKKSLNNPLVFDRLLLEITSTRELKDLSKEHAARIQHELEQTKVLIEKERMKFNEIANINSKFLKRENHPNFCHKLFSKPAFYQEMAVQCNLDVI